MVAVTTQHRTSKKERKQSENIIFSLRSFQTRTKQNDHRSVKTFIARSKRSSFVQNERELREKIPFPVSFRSILSHLSSNSFIFLTFASYFLLLDSCLCHFTCVRVHRSSI
uniref:(northern house mosquito) hypothetical protein n=1 Tax=Culex pipiens TaxID=7175 RepID=A0A8D8GDC2_CULPI